MCEWSVEWSQAAGCAQCWSLTGPRIPVQLRPLRRFKSHSNTSQNFVRASFAHSSLLVSGSEDGVLYMWDRENDEVLQTLEGHEGVVSRRLAGTGGSLGFQNVC